MELNKAKAEEIVEKAQESLRDIFDNIDKITEYNQKKVLDAFYNNKIGEEHFYTVTGYGHDDIGREALDRVYADTFKAECAIVRPHFVSGSHTIACALFGNLKYNDRLVSIAGEPYDTMQQIIGSRKDCDDFETSLIGNGVKYSEIPLKDGLYVDFENIDKYLLPDTKMVLIQRSRGYSLRNPLNIDDIERIVKIVKAKNPNICCFVDNCYGEFVEKKEPIEVGADVVAGSLIKNPGGGIAPTGGYIAGRKNLIAQISGRFTAPSLGTEVGSYNASYQNFFEGLFLAPHITSRVIKGSMLLGKTLSHCKINSAPSPSQIPHDIVRSIEFNDKEAMIKFVQMVQQISPVDSHVRPEPWAMPGYKDEIIMAAGTFVQGSSIELSCDGPVKPPYIAYIQGGITYEHIQILCENIIKKFGK